MGRACAWEEFSSFSLVAAIRANVFACFTQPFDYGEIASMADTALTAVDWHDGIQVASGLPHWLTLRVSCHLLTADRLVRFMTELQSIVRNIVDELVYNECGNEVILVKPIA